MELDASKLVRYTSCYVLRTSKIIGFLKLELKWNVFLSFFLSLLRVNVFAGYEALCRKAESIYMEFAIPLTSCVEETVELCSCLWQTVCMKYWLLLVLINGYYILSNIYNFFVFSVFPCSHDRTLLWCLTHCMYCNLSELKAPIFPKFQKV